MVSRLRYVRKNRAGQDIALHAPYRREMNIMKKKLRSVPFWVIAFTLVLTSSAIAYDNHNHGRDGGRHGNDGHHENRQGNYHHEHIDRPLATLALCVLYPAKCRPHPVIMKTQPVIVVQQPVIVTSPTTGDAVNIQIDGGGISQYTGTWWNGLPAYSKLKFVSTYVQTHKDGDAVLFRGKSYGDFVKSLNVFYQDSQNLNLSIDMALDVVTLKMNGYLDFADCMNGYYIMTSSPKLFQPEMVNAKFDECSKYQQP